MKSKKTKEQIYKESFALFTNGQIPQEIFDNYINDNDGEGVFQIQCWVLNNMKVEIFDWCTAISIIESVEHLYKCALENGNIEIQIIS